MSRRKILRATGIIAAANLLGLPLGIAVQALIARAYGTSAAMDAFNIAFLIPQSLTTIITANATVLLVPLMNRYAAQGKEEEGAAALGALFKNLTLALVAVLAGMALFGEPLLRLIAPGFDEETLSLSMRMLLVLLPAVFPMVGVGIAGALLQARYHFGGPAFAPFLYKFFAIGFVVFMAERWGIFVLVHAQVWSSVAGMLLLGFLLRSVQKIAWRGGLRHPDLPALFAAVFGPLLVFRLLDQVNFIIPHAVATQFGEGSVAALGYAWKLVGIPMSVLMMSLSAAIFPMYSRLMAEGNTEELRDTVTFGVRTSLLVAVATTVGFVFLGRPVVRFIFERGAFDAAATDAVYPLVVVYAFGIVGMGLNSVLGYYFWARQAHWLLVKIVAFGVGINMAVIFGLRPVLGVTAVAAGAAASYFAQSMCMAYFQRKDGVGVSWRALAGAACRTALAGAALAAVFGWLAPWVERNGTLWALLAALAVGGVVYGLAAWRLGVLDVRRWREWWPSFER